MRAIRRFLVTLAFAFWIGGFTFYSGVVIEVGAHVLESHRSQGMITQQVTHWLNFSGAIALAIFLWNLLASRKTAPRKCVLILFGTWIIMAFALAVLVVDHRYLDASIASDDVQMFDTCHSVYLVVSTVQWVAALVHMFVFIQVA